MIRRHVALLLPILVAAACGDAAVDVSVPRSEVAEAAWEAAFSDAEMTVHREGVVRWLAGVPKADVSGLPVVEGALVELFAPHPHGRRPLRKIAETTTGPDGRYRVGPGPTGAWLLRISKGDSLATWAGRAPLMRGPFPQPEGEADVLLREAHDVLVRVEDDAGRPVSGAAVHGTSVGYEQLIETDAEGVARMRAPAGSVTVEAADPRRRGARIDVAVPMPGGAAPARLVASDRGPVEGWVTDAATGAPLEGAVVLHLARPDLLSVTGSDGRFRLDAPREGRIAAFGRGRGWRSYPVPAAGDVEIRLDGAHVITGRVVDVDGNPVEGARLTAVSVNAEGLREPVLGPLSGADGAFRFDWVPVPHRGSRTDVHYTAHRRGLRWSPVRVAPEDASDVELRLGGERTIEGTVARERGAPCDRADVKVTTDTEGLHPVVARFLGVGSEVQCRTGDDGRFAAHAFPAHLPVDVEVVVDTVGITRRAEPGASGVVDVVIPDGRTISGRIVDVDGQPVTLGGEVRAELLNHPDFRRLVRVADAGPDGSFVIRDLPDGSYGVRAEVRGFDVAGAVAQAGAEDVRLVAEQPADLSFEIVFPEGATPEPVVVRLDDATDPAVPPRTVSIAPGGTGAIPLVRHGVYNVTALGGAWRCRRRDVDVADGRRPPMRLEMERTLVRSLVVEGADGQPLVGRRVIVAPVGSRGRRPEVYYTGEGGVVEVGGLAEGDWIARIAARGLPLLESRFTISADRSDEIRMRYPPHGTLEVIVDRERLEDPGAALVTLEDADGNPLNAWTPGADELASRWRLPEEGSLRLTGVVAGTVRVTVASGASDRATREARVEGGEDTAVRIP